jgi:O-antigen/teichoic acid export membrane protein
MQDAREPSPARRLLSDSGIYTGARVGSQAAAFVLVPLYTHALGSEGLGVVEVSNAARSVLTVVMLQGLNSALLRLHHQDTDPLEQKRLETTLVWYLIGSSLAICSLASVFAEPLWRLFAAGVPFYPFGIFTFGISAFAVMSAMLDRKLQTEQRARKFALVTLTRTVLTLATITVFVAPLGRGVAGKFEAELLVGLAGTIVAIVMIAPGPIRDFSSADLKRGLGWGLPLIPHGIASLINDAIDRVMLNSMLGLSAAGIYGLGYRVASVSLMIAMAVNQALMPLFIETMSKRERQQDPRVARTLDDELSRLGLTAFVLGALCVQGVTAVGPMIIALLGTEEFASSWLVLAPVGGGALAWCCYATWSQSVTYRKQGVRVLPWLTAAAAALNVGLNWVLIPRFGIEGAAWATFASNSLQALLVLMIGQRLSRVPYRWSRWLAIGLLSFAGLALLTFIELQVAMVALRYALKLVWLALFAVATLRFAGVKPSQLRPRRSGAA